MKSFASGMGRGIEAIRSAGISGLSRFVLLLLLGLLINVTCLTLVLRWDGIVPSSVQVVLFFLFFPSLWMALAKRSAVRTTLGQLVDSGRAAVQPLATSLLGSGAPERGKRRLLQILANGGPASVVQHSLVRILKTLCGRMLVRIFPEPGTLVLGAVARGVKHSHGSPQTVVWAIVLASVNIAAAAYLKSTSVH